MSLSIRSFITTLGVCLTLLVAGPVAAQGVSIGSVAITNPGASVTSATFSLTATFTDSGLSSSTKSGYWSLYRDTCEGEPVSSGTFAAVTAMTDLIDLEEYESGTYCALVTVSLDEGENNTSTSHTFTYTNPADPVPASLVITAPATDNTVITSDEYTFTANYSDDDELEDIIGWSITAGSCTSDGAVILDDSYTEIETSFVAGVFSVTLNMFRFDDGGESGYCFRVVPSVTEGEDPISAQRDFTYLRHYTVTGSKYEDVNKNGAFDPADTVVANWPIYLHNRETGAQFAVTQTDSNGHFVFSAPAGEWEIIEGTRRGWEQVRAYGGELRFIPAFVFVDLESLEDIESEVEEVAKTCFVTTGFDGRKRLVLMEDGDCIFLNVRTGEGNSSGTKVGARKAPTPRVLGSATSTASSTAGTSTSGLKCDGMYIKSYMRMGQPNDSAEVQKLQIFLNAVGYTIPVTSVFDTATDRAVREFQVKYVGPVLVPWGITTGTGYVFRTTRATINNMVCPGSEPVPTV